MSVEVTLSYYNNVFQTQQSNWALTGLNNSNFYSIMVCPAQYNTASTQVLNQSFSSDNSTWYLNFTVAMTGSDFFNAKLLQAPG